MFNRGNSDALAKQIRETVLKLQHAKERVTTPVDMAEETMRQSIRTLARSRISHMMRQLRAAKGYSYEEVAARTGLSKQLLFDLEYKDRRLAWPEVRLLAECYGVSLSDLLGVDLE